MNLPKEWIEYKGGGCPVPEDTLVNWRYLGQEPLEPFEVYDDDMIEAGELNWELDGIKGDITFYRSAEECMHS